MSRGITEIANALRAASNLDEVRRLADELSPGPLPGDAPIVEDKTDLPSLSFIECILPGLAIAIAGFSALVAVFVLIGAAIVLLFCTWNLDGVGMANSVTWLLGAYLVVYLGAGAVEALSEWFGRYRIPFLSV